MPDGVKPKYIDEITDNSGIAPIVYALRSDGEVVVKNIEQALPELKRREREGKAFREQLGV